jgi:hypothetical protein
MSRTKKQSYSGSKRFDSSCRCHGSCGWCRENRLHSDRKGRLAANDQLRVFKKADQD